MEIIHKKEKVYKQVPTTEFIDVPYYVTSDGREFKDEDVALKYERYLNRKTINVNNDTSITNQITFFYVESFQDIVDITYSNSVRNRYINSEYPLWIGLEQDDDGEYYYEVTLEELREYAESIHSSYLEIKKAIEGGE